MDLSQLDLSQLMYLERLNLSQQMYLKLGIVHIKCIQKPESFTRNIFKKLKVSQQMYSKTSKPIAPGFHVHERETIP